MIMIYFGGVSISTNAYAIKIADNDNDPAGLVFSQRQRVMSLLVML